MKSNVEGGTVERRYEEAAERRLGSNDTARAAKFEGAEGGSNVEERTGEVQGEARVLHDRGAKGTIGRDAPHRIYRQKQSRALGTSFLCDKKHCHFHFLVYRNGRFEKKTQCVASSFKVNHSP